MYSKVHFKTHLYPKLNSERYAYIQKEGAIQTDTDVHLRLN